MNGLIRLVVVCVVLIQTTKIEAQNNGDQTGTGQVYVNNFDDLTGLILNEANGTVTASSIIGTRTPEVTNALTLEHTSPGSVTAAIDLGQAYDKLYVQYYVSVINKSTASNYTNNFEVGQAIENLESAQVLMRHNTPNNQFSIFGQSSGGFLDTNYDSALGVWYKVGLEIDRFNLTVAYYINGRLVNTIAARNRDLRYITFGGTGGGSASYKVQYASLTVNTDHFQDIINSSNGVGDYTAHFIDYSVTKRTNYNGVDLSTLDKSDWTGLHAEPFDPDGGTNYIDGPSPYLYDVANNNVFAKQYDRFLFKKGVSHYIEALNKTNGISIANGAAYNSSDFNVLDSYGVGSMPIVNSSMIANPSDWEVYDVQNGIYRIPIIASSNATGAWQTGENRAHRQVFLKANLAVYSGSWFEDSTHFYIRLWDDSNPSLQEISIGTNQKPAFRPFTEIRNLHWRHCGILVADSMLVENCEFSKSSGATVTNSIFRDNELYDLWSGVDYGNTETNNTGLGTGGSGNGGGIGLRENALVYRNTIDDSYLAVNINTEAYDAVFAFNRIKNTVVNSITMAGNGNGDPLRPSLIANNTVFGGSRHVNNDPYPLTRPQPGHSFVHQNGGYGAFIFVNNLMLHHYNQNDEFPVQNVNSSNNAMSFVINSLVGAVGRIGYNRYYITPISNSPAVIFNTGGNNITTWGINMAAAGDFRDLDNVSNPDSTSEVVNTLPVLVAEYTDTSGKWLQTDPMPTVSGGGYYIDYASYGITHDLLGNPLGNDLSIGAVSSIISETYTYNGIWSPVDPNGVATSNDNIIIASGNAIINTNTTCNSVTVNAGAGLTVDSGAELSTNNGLTLESNSTSYSSLIRNGSIIGEIKYKRHVNINGSGATGSNDLVSAPLTSQPFNEFAASNPNILRNYDDTICLFGPFEKDSASYVTYASTETATLNPGIGYRTASTDNGTFTFTGEANSETVIIDIENYGTHEAEWNLIGNPYPSYLKVQDFLNHNVGGLTNLELFDTGTAAIYGYDGSAIDGWTIYNLATTTAETVIAPGQGFFVSADETKTEAYDLEFTPAMRSTGTDDDFIAGRNTELVYLKLKATNSSHFVTTDFYFNNDSSLGFDFGYDAEIWGGEAPEFAMYSHLIQDNSGKAFAIQSMDNTNLSNVTIPLGVNANQGEQLIFGISDSTLPSTVNVYLEDTITNTITLLNDLEYIITPATALSGTGRFFLIISEDTLSTATHNLNNLSIFALNSSKELIVSGQLHEQTTLNLYDIQGRSVIAIQLDTKSLKNRIDISNMSKGVYIINLNSTSYQITQKVVLN